MKLVNLLDDKLHQALKRLNSQQLPIATAIVLRNISLSIAKEIANYEDSRASLLSELGQKNESGNLIVDQDGQVQLDTENRATLVEKLQSLLDSYIELPTISIDMLTDARISVDDLILLNELID